MIFSRASALLAPQALRLLMGPLALHLRWTLEGGALPFPLLLADVLLHSLNTVPFEH